MKDVQCPYCGADIEINHDDGYGYEEDKYHFQECGQCEKTFRYTTSISFYYEADECPCQNGEEHDWQPIIGMPKELFGNRQRCSHCEEERKIEEETDV